MSSLMIMLIALIYHATSQHQSTKSYNPTVVGPSPPPLASTSTASQRLMRTLMEKRGPDIVKPKRNISEPVMVKFKMELYQVIELNERQQYVAVSAWVIERWYDEFVYWNPADYDNITEVKMHHSQVWIPDTTLYNTLVMKDDEQRRLLNVKVTTDWARRRAYVEFLYPAIYKFYCRLYLQFFPFDSQTCHMIFGSWTSDNLDIDYLSLAQSVGTSNYMPSEGWNLMGTSALRKEVKYVCCPNNYTLLDFTLYLRRRPLFYVVNLVIPTFIITLIAIVGFFTTSSTTGVREEKISLCITTLLSMSILMLMVSDQMPSTSSFIPLISWFYMCAIIIISVGSIAASLVISVQKLGRRGERLSKATVKWFRRLSVCILVSIPTHIQQTDQLLEKLNKTPKSSVEKKGSSDRKTTIGQLAKYIFTAGTEVQGYPNIINGCANGIEPLILNGNTENPIPTPKGTSPQPRRRGDVHRMPSLFSEMGEDDRLSTRHLAKVEYDWLTTVIERLTFLLFLLCFLCVSLTIIFVGVFHWYYSQPPSDATLTNKDL